MSRLYDSLVHESNIDLQSQVNLEGSTRWYISKPVPFCGWKTFWRRLRDAIKVLRGKAFAVHHAQDSIRTHWN